MAARPDMPSEDRVAPGVRWSLSRLPEAARAAWRTLGAVLAGGEDHRPACGDSARCFAWLNGDILVLAEGCSLTGSPRFHGRGLVADQPLLRLLPEDLAAHNDCTGVSNADLADRLIAGSGMLEMAALHACPADPGEALATVDWYAAAQFEAARRLREPVS